MVHLSRIAGAVALLGVASAAFALPKYAQKEKKPCGYCHTKTQGGGKRTAAGEWYKAHNHSMAGFKDPSAKPKKK